MKKGGDRRLFWVLFSLLYNLILARLPEAGDRRPMSIEPLEGRRVGSHDEVRQRVYNSLSTDAKD
jgi:hypothetical protein